MRVIYWIGGVGDKFGSLERYNVLLAEKCGKRGHSIVIMHDKPNTVAQYSQRLSNVHAQFVVVGNSYTDSLHAIPNAFRFMRSWKPDVVHTHFVNPILLPVLKILDIPLVYQTYHTGIDHPIAMRTRLVRWVVQNCTQRVFAVSERVRRDEIRAGVLPAHIQTLPLGLCIRDYLESAERCEEHSPLGFGNRKKRIIISVGRFFPEKGMRYVVEAAIEVVQKRSDVVWWLVGKDGPEKEYALSLVQRTGLTDKILFLGERNDVPSLMKEAYIQVVGSLYEGLPLMALESSAFGIPTVGTQVGGLDEAILDGVTGILVPRCSGSALAEATMKLLDDKNLREKMGNAARVHVENKYNAEKLVNNLIDIYERDFINITRKN